MADDSLNKLLAQLRLSGKDGSPEDLAEHCRQVGVDMFLKKDFDGAIAKYAEGLEHDIDDIELKAKLYNNRAAAYYHKKEYDACIKDCKAALELKPDYDKPLPRVAQCYLDMQSYTECVSWCNTYQDASPSTKPKLLEIRTTAKKAQVEKERLVRTNRKKQKELANAIERRRINVGMTYDGRDMGTAYLDNLKPSYRLLTGCLVELKHEVLYWPVMFLYPEYRQLSYVARFGENFSFKQQLGIILSPSNPPSWDVEKKYKLDNLTLFYTDKSTDEKVEFKISRTLLSIVKEKKHKIDHGTPEFFVVPKGSHPDDFPRFCE